MRTLIAASAVVSFIGLGIVISACGSKDATPTPVAPTAGSPCGQPGQPICNNGPPGTYTPQGPGPAPSPTYPTTAPPTAPTIAPTAPPPAATGMSTTGTIACTDDVGCGFAHCNKAVGKCATPCGSTALDCLPGNSCYVTPLGNVCGPATGLGTVLP